MFISSYSQYRYLFYKKEVIKQMSENKTSEAQKRATQAYREKNREKTRKQSAKSTTKTYINKYCSLEDLNELKEWIEAREKELKDE